MNESICRLDESALLAALDLAGQVFDRFVAPSYSQQGRESFYRFLDREERLADLRAGRFHLWGAYRGEQLVGMSATRGWDHVALLFVSADCQRQGVGRRLLEEMAACARAAGAAKLTVHAAPSSLATYLKWGFSPLGEEQTVDGIRFVPLERPFLPRHKMEHKGTQSMETQRLLLRPFRPEDGEAIYRNWASDPLVTRWLMWPAHGAVSVSCQVAQEWDRESARPDFYQWAIVLREEGEEPIGSISVVHMDEETATVHVGYCIGHRWWGRGITSEAFAALLPFFFEEMGASRVESRHDPRNPASGRVMEKCGLRYEGTLRCTDWNNQGICDAAYYGLLAEEYFAKRGN